MPSHFTFRRWQASHALLTDDDMATDSYEDQATTHNATDWTSATANDWYVVFWGLIAIAGRTVRLWGYHQWSLGCSDRNVEYWSTYSVRIFGMAETGTFIS